MRLRTAAGAATGIGALPHCDPVAAAALVLRVTPELPAVPRLPHRGPFERIVAQAAWGVPELDVTADGRVARRTSVALDIDAPVDTRIVSPIHDALIAFVDAAVRGPRAPRAVKTQVCGPLTLGLALVELGLPSDYAYARAARVVAQWANAIAGYVEHHLPDIEVVTFLDEPALARFGLGADPIVRDDAIDYLSSVLASVRTVTGLHVVTNGDERLAFDAGPSIVGLEVVPTMVDCALSIARFLDGGGEIAWGAVPTDRPFGERPTAQWRALAALWCELTQRGCDAERIRRQALITPTGGLHDHGVTQAERALQLAREIGGFVREQAIATRLTIGA